MVKHPTIRKLSFTGDCTTGSKIREMAGVHLKDLTLELGGSDPMIVMPDAAIDKAVEGALRGRFYNAGQTCTAVKRLYVHEKISLLFIQKLKERVDALSVGNGLGSRIDMGPMNSAEQREKISQIVEETREKQGGNNSLPEDLPLKEQHMSRDISIVQHWSAMSFLVHSS